MGASKARELNFDVFKFEGLHEKNAAATWSSGTVLTFAWRQETQENLRHNDFRLTNNIQFLNHRKLNAASLDRSVS